MTDCSTCAAKNSAKAYTALETTSVYWPARFRCGEGPWSLTKRRKFNQLAFTIIAWFWTLMWAVFTTKSTGTNLVSLIFTIGLYQTGYQPIYEWPIGCHWLEHCLGPFAVSMEFNTSDHLQFPWNSILDVNWIPFTHMPPSRMEWRDDNTQTAPLCNRSSMRLEHLRSAMELGGDSNSNQSTSIAPLSITPWLLPAQSQLVASSTLICHLQKSKPCSIKEPPLLLYLYNALCCR